MEIIRRDELQELLDVVRMKPYGKILITGAAGSGKTFLLTTLIISKKPGNTGISRDIRTEFTTDLLLSD